MSTTPNNQNSSKLYRFALYGRSSSGKTCILAALAMPHGSHPKNYTATVHPIDLSLAKNETERAGLEKNKAWISEATSFLKRGEILPPTPIDVHLRFQYEFTTPEHQNYWIELLDYSGELIEPDLTGGDLAKDLREKLKKMDGLLVLAEAPRQKDGENENYEAFEELYKLQQAFTSLRREMQDGENLNLPIALLINKWDRLGNIERSNLEAEQTKLEAFFQNVPHPPHRELERVLSSVISEGNFKKFPVSALGECELIENETNHVIERPIKTNPLHSFGLEDAFIWMAQHLDEMDFQRFSTEAKEYRLSRVLSVEKEKAKRFIETGNTLVKRFSESSEQAKSIHKWVKSCERIIGIKSSLKKFGIAILVMVIFGLILCSITYFIDKPQFTNHQSTLEKNKVVSEKQSEDAEKWFNDYIHSHRYILSRHMLPYLDTHYSVSEAENMLKDLRNLRENTLWLSVTAKVSDDRISAVEKYIREYPYGEHTSEAQKLLSTSKFEKRVIANKEYLQELSEKTASKESMKLDELRALLDKSHKPPFPDEETSEQGQLRSKLSDELSKYVTNFVLNQDWTEFENSYNQLMSNGNIKEAATALVTKTSSDVRLEKLKERFAAQVVPKIKEQVEQALQNGSFSQATTAIAQYAEISPLLTTEEGKKQIDQLSLRVNREYDQALYRAIKRSPDDENIASYLNHAPLQSMRKSVEAYKSFLNELNSTLMLGMALTLEWNNQWGYTDNDVALRINGQHIVDQKKAPAATISSSQKISVEKSTSLKVEVYVTGHGILWDSTAYGIKSKTAQDIVNSGSISVDIKKKKDKDSSETVVGTATVRVIGYPMPPTLPEWTE